MSNERCARNGCTDWVTEGNKLIDEDGFTRSFCGLQCWMLVKNGESGLKPRNVGTGVRYMSQEKKQQVDDLIRALELTNTHAAHALRRAVNLEQYYVISKLATHMDGIAELVKELKDRV